MIIKRPPIPPLFPSYPCSPPSRISTTEVKNVLFSKYIYIQGKLATSHPPQSSTLEGKYKKSKQPLHYMTGLSKTVTFSCNRGPRIKRKVGGKVRTKYIHIPLCFDGDRERSRVDPVNFMDDPVIGQSRVIYIVSIPWDCC